jgi:SAM-dependent methyltransferase
MQYFAVSEQREQKARKIEVVLSDYLGVPGITGRSILDLGCGSGHIAGHFSVENEVIGADIIDQVSQENKGGWKFTKLDSVRLPFRTGRFDIVIYNHVFFCEADKPGRLKEIHRVLKDRGVCYFASANRYFPVDGFTKLCLVHYLPGRLFRAWYKIALHMDEDLYPVGYHGMLKVIRQSDFHCRDYTSDILRHPSRYESEIRVPLPVPVCLSPTNVFILTKKGWP